uniref:Triple QxxK/R motif-containing protein n=1 Tax=Sinocyclocheilus grahami TaxID=75366 RepID=A0A672P841_SINGR
MGKKDASSVKLPVDQYRKQIVKQDYKKTKPALRATRLKAEVKRSALGIRVRWLSFILITSPSIPNDPSLPHLPNHTHTHILFITPLQPESSSSSLHIDEAEKSCLTLRGEALFLPHHLLCFLSIFLFLSAV